MNAGPARLHDFGRAPFLVIWEVTRACALACLHCRADAMPRRDPRELTTEEGCRLIDRVRAFGDPPPLLVLTGGDPMRRPDLAALVRHAAGAGLKVALTPSGTAAATRVRLAELQQAGLSRLAVSVDGPTPDTHDAFRRVRGSYAWTMRIIEDAVDLGLPLQINSTVSRMTLPYLVGMAARVGELPVTLWALFFLIQTGRATELQEVTPGECERVLDYLYDLSLRVPFGVKTTEAPHYQRVKWTREHEHGPALPHSPSEAPRRRPQFRAPRTVNDGNGFVFVDYLGNVCPSGFLPLPRGNVRTADLCEIYRCDEVFRRLRHPDALAGKCRRCGFRALCGGSRARAFAATGDVMAADPLCVYQPGRAMQPLIDAA